MLSVKEVQEEVNAAMDNIAATKGEKFAEAVNAIHGVMCMMQMICDEHTPGAIKRVLALPIATTVTQRLLQAYGIADDKDQVREVMDAAKGVDKILEKTSSYMDVEDAKRTVKEMATRRH